MTTPDQRWTEETVALVARVAQQAFEDDAGPIEVGYAAMVALADAGLLLPPRGQRVADTVARQRLLVQQAKAERDKAQAWADRVTQEGLDLVGEVDRQRAVIDTARAAVVELANKNPSEADWADRVIVRLRLLVDAVDDLDAQLPSATGCTCPWNNGYRLGPLGHHIDCPALAPGHKTGDGCDARLPYDMGHTDPRLCQPVLALPTGNVYSTCSLPAGHDGDEHANASGQPWRFNEHGDILMNSGSALSTSQPSGDVR